MFLRRKAISVVHACVRQLDLLRSFSFVHVPKSCQQPPSPALGVKYGGESTASMLYAGLVHSSFLWAVSKLPRHGNLWMVRLSQRMRTPIYSRLVLNSLVLGLSFRPCCAHGDAFVVCPMHCTAATDTEHLAAFFRRSAPLYRGCEGIDAAMAMLPFDNLLLRTS